MDVLPCGERILNFLIDHLSLLCTSSALAATYIVPHHMFQLGEPLQCVSVPYLHINIIILCNKKKYSPPISDPTQLFPAKHVQCVLIDFSLSFLMKKMNHLISFDSRNYLKETSTKDWRFIINITSICWAMTIMGEAAEIELFIWLTMRLDL